MFFHQFAWGAAVPLAVKSVSEFPIIFIWKDTLSKHWHSRVPWKNRWWGNLKINRMMWGDGERGRKKRETEWWERGGDVSDWQWKGGWAQIDGLKAKLTAFRQNVIFLQALTLSQSVNHEWKIREAQMPRLAEYQMKANMLNIWEQTQMVVLDLFCRILVVVMARHRGFERWLRGACRKLVPLLPS